MCLSGEREKVGRILRFKWKLGLVVFVFKGFIFEFFFGIFFFDYYLEEKVFVKNFLKLNYVFGKFWEGYILLNIV